jgi:hypothetical protein
MVIVTILRCNINQICISSLVWLVRAMSSAHVIALIVRLSNLQPDSSCWKLSRRRWWSSGFVLVLLDAKSAFDLVVLKMLLKKVYLTGINPASWSLIDDLHHNTKTCIKWMNELSEEFPIFQGVKQGGILSADLEYNSGI